MTMRYEPSIAVRFSIHLAKSLWESKKCMATALNRIAPNEEKSEQKRREVQP